MVSEELPPLIEALEQFYKRHPVGASQTLLLQHLARTRLDLGPTIEPIYSGYAINAASIICLFLAITSARNFFTLPFRFIAARRAAKLGRCPTCGYDLTGLPTPVCPECGRPHSPHSTPSATAGQPDLIPTSRPSDPT